MSAHQTQNDMSLADFTIPDPGSSGAIRNDRYGVVGIVTAGAETRTLAAPTRVGLKLHLCDQGIVTSCAITVANNVNKANNTILTMVPGESCVLEAGYDGSATPAWLLTANDDVALS